MRRCLLDANILLRRVEVEHPHHTFTVNALKTLIDGGDELYIAPQSLYEFWAVATRPVAARGLGFSVAQTAPLLTYFKAAFRLLNDTPDVYTHWERLVVQHGTQGKPTHDARLIAFMLSHNLTHLLTFNGTDFRRYEVDEGILILNPASV